MNVAVVGCLHGKLEFLYEELKQWEDQSNQKVDFILCSGDFQSLRNKADMAAMECPEKYKELGQFHRFFTGELKAPILTIFVGGNHEATNYLRDLYYGGWAAENIYFLGASGFVNIKKGSQTIKLGGVSGIEKYYDYLKGYCERPPYVLNHDWLRSIYHVRHFEIQKVKLMSGAQDSKVHMFMSHEWPTVITQRARKDQVQNLLRFKKHFQQDVSQGRLGSRGFSEILDEIKPNFWFSAHLHVRFQAVIDNQTEFLALDKPLPKRQYLDVFNVPDGETRLRSVFRQNSSFKMQNSHHGGNYKDRFSNQRDSQNYEIKYVRKNKEDAQVFPQNLEEEVKQDSSLPQQEEEKSSASHIILQNVRIEYDPYWIAILQSTQEMIPLESKNYNFNNLNSQNKELHKTIQNKFALLKDQDLSIPFIREDLFAQYEDNVHPTTAKLIKRFNLDDRLFNPEIYLKKQTSSKINTDQGSEVSQSRQTEGEDIKDEQAQEIELGQRSFQQAFQKVNDENEIDLDDLE